MNAKRRRNRTRNREVTITLPRELLLLVFEHLDAKSIVASSLVCVELESGTSFQENRSCGMYAPSYLCSPCVTFKQTNRKQKCEQGVTKKEWRAFEQLKEQQGFSWKEAFKQTVLFPDSTILDISDKFRLGKWLGPSAPLWRLRYKATQHGFHPKHFHELCDNVGPTVCIGVTYAPCQLHSQRPAMPGPKRYFYGGYNPNSWSPNPKKKKQAANAREAFIFSLCNPHDLCPVRMFPTKGSQACHYSKLAGPLFGNGDDFGMMCAARGEKNKAWCRVGSERMGSEGKSYRVPKRYGGIPQLFFTGSEEFRMDDLEVYSLAKMPEQLS
ncbi:NimA-related protein kinase 4 [Balamuthia mandrillaris]